MNLTSFKKYLPILGLTLLIVLGSVFYLDNLKREQALLDKKIKAEGRLSEIQSIHIHFFDAVKNNRGYHIKQLPFYIKNYDSLKSTIAGQFENYKQYHISKEESTLFKNLEHIINLRFSQLDSNLMWLNQFEPKEALRKINFIEPQVQKSIDVSERDFYNLENYLKNQSDSISLISKGLRDKNTFIFFIWQAFALILTLFLFFKIIKKSESLKKSELRFKGILNSTISFISLLDKNGSILHTNQAALDFGNLNRKDVKGKKFWECYWWQISKETQGQLKQNIAKVANGETLTYEVAIWGKDKNPETLLFNLKPLVDEETGKVYNIIAEGRSIQGLVEYRNELISKNQELEQFAFIASHDLQEPLRMVTNFLSQLERKYSNVLDDKARKYIFFAVDGANRMRQIILDLLEFSRIGKNLEKVEPISIPDIINDISKMYKKVIDEKKATIVHANLPGIVSFKAPVFQIFSNLISNALKYAKDDVPPKIEIKGIKTPNGCQFSVKDNGIGIDKEYFDKIFVIFQRLHDKEKYTGTGIGLAVVKKDIDILGGKIWLESTLGEGTTFYLNIPNNTTI